MVLCNETYNKKKKKADEFFIFINKTLKMVF